MKKASVITVTMVILIASLLFVLCACGAEERDAVGDADAALEVVDAAPSTDVTPQTEEGETPDEGAVEGNPSEGDEPSGEPDTGNVPEQGDGTQIADDTQGGTPSDGELQPEQGDDVGSGTDTAGDSVTDGEDEGNGEEDPPVEPNDPPQTGGDDTETEGDGELSPYYYYLTLEARGDICILDMSLFDMMLGEDGLYGYKDTRLLQGEYVVYAGMYQVARLTIAADGSALLETENASVTLALRGKYDVQVDFVMTEEGVLAITRETENIHLLYYFVLGDASYRITKRAGLDVWQVESTYDEVKEALDALAPKTEEPQEPQNETPTQGEEQTEGEDLIGENGAQGNEPQGDDTTGGGSGELPTEEDPQGDPEPNTETSTQEETQENGSEEEGQGNEEPPPQQEETTGDGTITGPTSNDETVTPPEEDAGDEEENAGGEEESVLPPESECAAFLSSFGGRCELCATTSTTVGEEYENYTVLFRDMSEDEYKAAMQALLALTVSYCDDQVPPRAVTASGSFGSKIFTFTVNVTINGGTYDCDVVVNGFSV